MDDYLPLSMLNQLEYCERRFFLMHVRGEMEVNAQHMTGKKNPKAFLPSDRGGAYCQNGSAYLNNASAARSNMGTPRTSVS